MGCRRIGGCLWGLSMSLLYVLDFVFCGYNSLLDILCGLGGLWLANWLVEIVRRVIEKPKLHSRTREC